MRHTRPSGLGPRTRSPGAYVHQAYRDSRQQVAVAGAAARSLCVQTCGTAAPAVHVCSRLYRMNELVALSTGLPMRDYPKDGDLNLYRRAEFSGIASIEGEEGERGVYRAVCQAADRSIFSMELARAIADWPSQYHLDRRRHCLLGPGERDSLRDPRPEGRSFLEAVPPGRPRRRAPIVVEPLVREFPRECWGPDPRFPSSRDHQEWPFR